MADTLHVGLARVSVDDVAHVALVENGVATPLPEFNGSMVDLIVGGTDRLNEARELARGASRIGVELSAVRLLAPIDRFRRDVICAGWNYWAHFEESKGKREGQDVDKPNAPTFFTKAPDVVIGPTDPIGWDPRISVKWDYEAEIAVIIGKTCRSVPVDAALEYVFGYCLANDVSQRDLQRRHGGQWFKGKSIDATMPLGPWIIPADTFTPDDVQLSCVVNGELRQNASTKLMAFSIAELIAEASFGMTLYAGDVLLTGTPAGIGNAMEPPCYLVEGDEVVVSATGMGELHNRFVRADLYGASDVIIGGAKA
ncbi:fumarylacetoacetate hydrolase family protein [Paraburkholderia sp.]|uniref:fumarylacetoacetate hydrolase family protein n=1 Tax=Paraburkholderia sp. TaxID=1926495 RepID=UPI003D6F0D9B